MRPRQFPLMLTPALLGVDRTTSLPVVAAGGAAARTGGAGVAALSGAAGTLSGGAAASRAPGTGVLTGAAAPDDALPVVSVAED